jgi:adenylate kinase family enzyme
MARDRVSPLGNRIVIVGNSGAGKSTLAEQLAALLQVPCVELDALYWHPGWQAAPEAEFHAKLTAAVSGDGWVVAGAYHRHTSLLVWPRAQTVIWLDMPLPLVIARILWRSWWRSRKKELLWGTNTHRFWKQLKLWSPSESLIAYTLGDSRKKHERYLAAMADPKWAHLRFVRLRSAREVQKLIASLTGGP